MQQWRFTYKEHNIEVRNSVKGEALLVDGALQDERIGLGMRSRLYGRIKTGAGQGEPIKVSLGGWFGIRCIAFIDDHEVFRS